MSKLGFRKNLISGRKTEDNKASKGLNRDILNVFLGD